MTDIEPAGGDHKRIVARTTDKDPALGKPGWFEVREQRRQRRQLVHNVQLEAVIVKLRLLAASETHDEQVQLHMAKLDKIEEELARTDNPVRRLVLNRAMQHWLNMSERIIDQTY